MKRLTLTQMIKANKEVKQNWFSVGAMEFFNTQIVDQPNKFNMFITSDYCNVESEKKFTIHYFNKSKVSTIGAFQAFDTLEEAKKIRLTIAKALETMSNRETWIMENLYGVEFEESYMIFIAYDNNGTERKAFHIAYDGNICG
jgi:hypothetical protein